MIRAERGGAYAADWLNRNVIGIGWDFDGADSANMSREQIREARQTRLPAGPRYSRRAASSSYPMIALCLSSSESASFVRAPETMSWIQT